MEFKAFEEVNYDVRYLKVSAGVRYWGDARVNGIDDEQGDLIPCRVGDNWCPLIDVDHGVITNWTQGVVADIHYKVCDVGVYTLQGEGYNTIKKMDGYVPNIMCPEPDGFGDYIIMKVEEDGTIQNWKKDLSDWNN